MLAALAAPRRREILRLVWDEERPAGDVHAALGGISFAAVSQHLKVLETADLVTCRKLGRQRLYRARPEALGPLRPWLERMWDSALYRLTLAAELEAGRRGPRPRPTRLSRSSRSPRSTRSARSTRSRRRT